MQSVDNNKHTKTPMPLVGSEPETCALASTKTYTARLLGITKHKELPHISLVVMPKKK